MTEIDEAGGLLPWLRKELAKEFHKSLATLKKEIFRKKNLRYFLYYACGNFAILALYTLFETTQQGLDLSLKPVTSPAIEGSWILFALALAILPVEILLEEFAFRLFPMVWIKNIFHLNTITISIEDDKGFHEVHNSRLRLWLYHHWNLLFIVISGLWAAWIHQINIVESSMLGSLIYFAVQLFSGLFFAWLYVYRGLGSSWIVHVSWDLFLVALNLILLSQIF